jgi:Spy/CpxP family protein refolding chaperone
MKRALVMFVLLLAAAPAWAEKGHGDAIHDKLFPPELIMGHQQELGIDDKQREAIVKEVQKAQATITETDWQLQAAAQELGQALDGARLDEARILQLADKVMGLEHDVKKAHLGLLVRVRNLLTDAQRAKLEELRKQQP